MSQRTFSVPHPVRSAIFCILTPCMSCFFGHSDRGVVRIQQWFSGLFLFYFFSIFFGRFYKCKLETRQWQYRLRQRHPGVKFTFLKVTKKKDKNERKKSQKIIVVISPHPSKNAFPGNFNREWECKIWHVSWGGALKTPFGTHFYGSKNVLRRNFRSPWELIFTGGGEFDLIQ